jgi:quercetin dioxygenase-like cupin family protein
MLALRALVYRTLVLASAWATAEVRVWTGTNTIVQWIRLQRCGVIRRDEQEGSMNAARIVTVAAMVASGLVWQIAMAQPAGIRRIDLQRQNLSIPGREVIQTIVELDAGVKSSRHTHPGEEIVYVLEGAPLEYEVEGKPPVTLKPGDVLFIPANTIHSARNVGTRKGAELATYIVEKGKPLLTDVK